MDMNEKRDKKGLTLAEVIADYNSNKYRRPSLSADIVILTRQNGGLKLLMIKRGGHPFLGYWALPGGFANPDETIEQTAARELEEETGIAGLDLRLIGIYSAPGRDPRGWTVTAAFGVLIPDGIIDAEAGDDAADIKWVDVRIDNGDVIIDIPDNGEPAFDHKQVITDAVRMLTGISGIQ